MINTKDNIYTLFKILLLKIANQHLDANEVILE